MCNLYDIGPVPRNRRYPWEKDLFDLVKDMSYVAPGRPGVVAVREEGESDIAGAIMQWGFRRTFGPQGKKVARNVNNARNDKLDGHMWKYAFQERRCLIPVRQFYEWSGPKGAKTKYAISLGDPDHWFYIGGIWEEDKDAEGGRTYSMITTEANEQMSALHDRMPLVLPEGSVEPFLDPETEAMELVRPYEGELVISGLRPSVG